MSFSAESVVAQMDFAGVDMGLLHRTPYLGVGNEYIADCVKRFPNRLQGLAHVEEWLVQTQPDEAIWRLRRAINELELDGLQWLPGHMELYGQSEPWDSEGFRPFWDEFRRPRRPRVLHAPATHRAQLRVIPRGAPHRGPLDGSLP